MGIIVFFKKHYSSTYIMASDRDNASHLDGKHEVEQHEVAHEKPVQLDPAGENTFEVQSDELPPGYFRSPFFLGSMTGISLGLMAGVAGFGFAAPILGIINNDIGPVSYLSLNQPPL